LPFADVTAVVVGAALVIVFVAACAGARADSFALAPPVSPGECRAVTYRGALAGAEMGFVLCAIAIDNRGRVQYVSATLGGAPSLTAELAAMISLPRPALPVSPLP
jgi:hypothetical protein